MSGRNIRGGTGVSRNVSRQISIHLHEVRCHEIRCMCASERQGGTPGRRIKLEDLLVEVLIELHNGGLVAAAVAVVWCREEREDAICMLSCSGEMHVRG